MVRWKRDGAAALLGALMVVACSSSDGASGPPGGAGGVGGAGVGGESGAGVGGAGAGGTGVTGGVTQSKKLDLLLMIDNSISMADKQAALRNTIPELVSRITASGSGVTDLHVGVISSSLGAHGTVGICTASDTGTVTQEQSDDHAHLITTRPRGKATGVADVITWDPSRSATTLTEQIQSVVGAVGEFGCGFESQLESFYRFLVDPAPPASVGLGPCPDSASAMCTVLTGVDDALLQQRSAFLRPDSVVAVVLLTDENDCSVRDEGQYHLATEPKTSLAKGSSVCATNPNDPCCFSCAGTPPDGCPADLCPPPITTDVRADALNLRCFDEKRRFGMDFLYPVERYVSALTRPELCTSRADLSTTAGDCPDANGDGHADIVKNPLLNGASGVFRNPSMVYVLGITGVPWQDLAVGGPTAPSLALKSPAALAADRTWSVILGDPAASPPVAPTDALMIESIGPRVGKDVTGTPIPGPGGPNNAINGHDYVNSALSDLQFACIFPLPESLDCLQLQRQNPAPGCSCGSNVSPADDNPVCQNPADGSYGNTQFFGRAYPGVRELSLLRALGNQGVTASVCPKNLKDPAAPDYGYRPAVAALAAELARSVR